MAREYGQDCPIARTAEVLAERWTPLIVRQLLRGRTRFHHFIDDLPGIPPRLLAERLKRLEAENIVDRRVLAGYPPRVDYCLTAKGEALRVLMLAMAEWGSDHCSADQRIHLVHQGCGGVVQVTAVCDCCGQPIHPHEVAAAAIDEITPIAVLV